VEPTWNDWRVAADLGRELASKGHRLPISDLVIGAIAKRLSEFLYSTDPHFDLIVDLKRFRP
jgi:predicted nucleic acid-binding protein